jgi:hypothetical protein
VLAGQKWSRSLTSWIIQILAGDAVLDDELRSGQRTICADMEWCRRLFVNFQFLQQFNAPVAQR